MPTGETRHNQTTLITISTIIITIIIIIIIVIIIITIFIIIVIKKLGKPITCNWLTPVAVLAQGASHSVAVC